MTKVFIRHKVENYGLWKQAFDDFLAQRKAAGELSYTLGHIPNEADDLCLTFEWDSVANANAFFASDALKAAMPEAGVTEPPLIIVYENTAEGQTYV